MKASHKHFLKNFKAEVKVHSPGRINFIGEHTDYNDGFVLPTAIDKKITLLLKKNGSQSKCNVYSENYDTFFDIDLNTISPSEIVWENFILGVINEIQQRSDKIRGFDCVIQSNLPVGSGISSSAALECGLASGINCLFNIQLEQDEIISLSQAAEHSYVGTQCGIMDQYASVMSVAGKVILLDCKTQRHRYINANFDPYVIVLLNTNVSHNLASSEYNTRREECEIVVSSIRKENPDVTSLREVTKAMLDVQKEKLTETLLNRASYVLEENDRVLTAAGALEEGNLERFGALMYDSHHGLQHKYEVSCPELDFMVNFSKNHPQVIGSRMMGGGFGGCTINLIKADFVDAFIKQIATAYKEAFGIEITSFTTVPSVGTQIEIL